MYTNCHELPYHLICRLFRGGLAIGHTGKPYYWMMLDGKMSTWGRIFQRTVWADVQVSWEWLVLEVVVLYLGHLQHSGGISSFFVQVSQLQQIKSFAFGSIKAELSASQPAVHTWSCSDPVLFVCFSVWHGFPFFLKHGWLHEERALWAFCTF